MDNIGETFSFVSKKNVTDKFAKRYQWLVVSIVSHSVYCLMWIDLGFLNKYLQFWKKSHNGDVTNRTKVDIRPGVMDS